MNTADGHDRCENCRYFQPNETNGETGDCRRYAPRPLQEGRPLSVLAPAPPAEPTDPAAVLADDGCPNAGD